MIATQATLPFAGIIANTLAVELGSYYPRYVGAADNTGFQDRIPTRPKQSQALPDNLHTEGGGLHAGRNPRYDKQADYLRNWEQPMQRVRIFLVLKRTAG